VGAWKQFRPRGTRIAQIRRAAVGDLGVTRNDGFPAVGLNVTAGKPSLVVDFVVVDFCSGRTFLKRRRKDHE
jgi:hypothetical protein